MKEFLAFLTSIVANVVSYIICKWLEKEDKQ